MFLLIVQKMRQALTFLATIENDDRGHENTGRHFDSGAAHDFRGGLHRPASDKRSAGGARGELNRPFELPLGGDEDAFGGSISQADKPAGRGGGVLYCFAHFRRGISCPAASENGQRVAYPGRVEWDGGPRGAPTIRTRHNGLAEQERPHQCDHRQGHERGADPAQGNQSGLGPEPPHQF
jgi:hypothetical protein